MFDDTQPAPIGDDGTKDAHAAFRVTEPRELLALLCQLRDGNTALNLNAPQGRSLSTSVWAVDSERQRLCFSADEGSPQLHHLVAADEAVAVAYMDSVKLQFDLRHLVLVRGNGGVTLQAAMPTSLYRFQRRQAYRVRTPERGGPVARLRHPSIPEMALALRVLDVSIGGCALLLPHDVPPLQPGSRLADVQIDIDADTRFPASLTLQYVSSIQLGPAGLRLGCEWVPQGGNAERALQRYIDQTQKRHRLLAHR